MNFHRLVGTFILLACSVSSLVLSFIAELQSSGSTILYGDHVLLFDIQQFNQYLVVRIKYNSICWDFLNEIFFSFFSWFARHSGLVFIHCPKRNSSELFSYNFKQIGCVMEVNSKPGETDYFELPMQRNSAWSPMDLAAPATCQCMYLSWAHSPKYTQIELFPYFVGYKF